MTKKRIVIYAALLAAAVGTYFVIQLVVRLQNPPVQPRLDKDFQTFFSKLDAARALREAGKLQEAGKALLQILEEYKDSPAVRHHVLEPRFDLAEIYEGQKQYALAEKQYQTIIASTTNPDALVRARIGLGAMKAHGDGGVGMLRDLFREFGMRQEVAAKICIKLADALAARGDFAEAAAVLSQTLSEGRSSNALLLNQLNAQLTQALEKQAAKAGSPAGAAEVYETQARAFPAMADAWRWLEKAAVFHAQAGSFPEARNLLNAIIRDYPGEGDSQARTAEGRIEELDKAEVDAASRLTPAGTAARVKAGEKLNVVKSNVTQSAAWSPAQGTYVVEGRVDVRRPAELVVEAGTRVEFGLHASLVIYGKLTVKGTAESPVTFASAADRPSFFDWAGVEFVESAECVVEHAVISNASRGIVCSAAGPRLVGVSVTACGNAAIECRKAAAPAIIEPRITRNDAAGIVFDGSAGSVEGGLIAGNRRGGLLARRNSKPAVSGTVIDANGLAGVQCFDGSDVTLEKAAISNNLGAGIHAVFSKPAISGCTVAGNSGIGIICESGSDAKIGGCAIERNGGGVSCKVASSPAIDACRLASNDKYGIRCESGSRPEITGCTFEKLIGPGILSLDVSRPKVRGNHFPPEGISIRIEGNDDLRAADNVWPAGVDARKLVEDKATGAGKGEVVLK